MNGAFFSSKLYPQLLFLFAFAFSRFETKSGYIVQASPELTMCDPSDYSSWVLGVQVVPPPG